MKIGLICSHGSHLTETMQIMGAFAGHNIFMATYHSPRDAEVKRLARAHFTENIGANPWRMVKGLVWAGRVLRREKPDVIISLGAEIALPFFYLGKLMGSKTVFIESWCRVENLSQTGRLVYPVADIFLVQWPELLPACGPKAQYLGAVI